MPESSEGYLSYLSFFHLLLNVNLEEVEGRVQLGGQSLDIRSCFPWSPLLLNLLPALWSCVIPSPPRPPPCPPAPCHLRSWPCPSDPSGSRVEAWLPRARAVSPQSLVKTYFLGEHTIHSEQAGDPKRPASLVGSVLTVQRTGTSGSSAPATPPLPRTPRGQGQHRARGGPGVQHLTVWLPPSLSFPICKRGEK